MLFGETLQQAVQVSLLRVDAGVDLGRGDSDFGLHHQALRNDVASRPPLRRDLLPNRIAGILGLAQLQAGRVELAGSLGHARSGVLAVGALHFDIAQPKILQASLGLFELGLVASDLLVQEGSGHVGVFAAGAEAGLDEDRGQRLDDEARPVLVVVLDSQRIQVVAACVADFDPLAQVRD